MDKYFGGLSDNNSLDLEGMIDVIECSGKDNAYLLIEAEKNPFERFKLRDLFFKATKEIKNHNNLPFDKWED
jgi:hypothetical protein